MKRIFVSIAMYTVILNTMGCRPKPTAANLLHSAQALLKCVKPPQVPYSSVNVDGEYAVGTAEVLCTNSVDDGTLGRSCRNILGCYKDVTTHQHCAFRFHWKAEWVLEDGQCNAAPMASTIDLLDRVVQSSLSFEAKALVSFLLDSSISREAKSVALGKMIKLAENSYQNKKWNDAQDLAYFILNQRHSSASQKAKAQDLADKVNKAIMLDAEQHDKNAMDRAQRPEEIPDWLKKQQAPPNNK